MISRRVLLVMIAAVGLFVPTWLEMDIRLESVPLWLVSQMAEWDSWRPAGSHSNWGNGSRDPSPPQFSLNEPGPALTVEITPVRFEAISVENADASNVADQLNRAAEGLDIRNALTPKIASKTAPDSPHRDKSIGVSGPTIPVSVDSLELRLALSLCEFADVSLADSKVPEPADDIFADHFTGYEPPEEERASEPAHRPIASASPPEYEPIVVEEAVSATAYELNRASEGFGIELTEAARLSDRSSRSTDRPAIRRVSRKSRKGIARHNRLNPEVVQHPHASHGGEWSAGGSVGQALRLTGDAADAWLNLLAGPTSAQFASR